MEHVKKAATHIHINDDGGQKEKEKEKCARSGRILAVKQIIESGITQTAARLQQGHK